jgi:hypothetical protein
MVQQNVPVVQPAFVTNHLAKRGQNSLLSSMVPQYVLAVEDSLTTNTAHLLQVKE